MEQLISRSIFSPATGFSRRSGGIPTGSCVTPLLPLAEPARFIDRLVEFQPDVLVIKEFHDSGGGYGADTGKTHGDCWSAGGGRQRAIRL